PLAKLAAKVMAGRTLAELGFTREVHPSYFSVKEAVFPFVRFPGIDIVLGPEMKSTGEVMGIDRSFESAFFKALIAAGLAMPDRGSILITLADEDKSEALDMIRQLSRMGFRLYATEGTASMIERAGMPVQMVTKRIGRGSPDMLDVILDGTVDGVINTPGPADKEILDGLEIRRAAVERGIPCMTSVDTARTVVDAMEKASSIYAVESIQSYRRTGFGY
ncbi:MAG: carbamoyl phosphate synthase large subunit, partial [Chloroflexota bacterium]|nr:carbamoyl phosphate synthase large subunit [Chloroflexota bacterium]